jgi:enamine deaminase RidA (YjgF/YER057c/UK114 family)
LKAPETGRLAVKRAVGLFATAFLFTAAYGGARDEARVVMPDNPDARKLRDAWGFSDAIVIDNTVYLSGVVASTKDGDQGLEDAYDRAFGKLGSILAKAGASWDDVIDITSFHTDLKTQMPAIVAVKNRYVHAPFPAWTAIEVSRLIPDKGITEIKLVAKLPARPRKL